MGKGDRQAAGMVMEGSCADLAPLRGNPSVIHCVNATSPPLRGREKLTAQISYT